MTKQQSSKVSELRESLKTIILALSKAKRIELSVPIKLLCEHFKLTENLTDIDRRGKHWAERPEEEKLEVQRRQMEKARAYQKELREKVKALREEKLQYEVTVRGESCDVMNLIDAAKVVNKPPKNLYMAIYKMADKTKYFNIDDKIITIKKIK